MIIRVKHVDHFTVIRNQTLRDSRLSYRARGLLAYLLSLPDDAALSRDYLADAGLDGIRSVRAGLKELADAGYITYQKHQNDRGQWITEATVFECSTEGAKRAAGKAGKGHRPKARYATVGNRASSRKTKEGTTALKAVAPPEKAAVTGEFRCENPGCDRENDYLFEDKWLCEACYHKAQLERTLERKRQGLCQRCGKGPGTHLGGQLCESCNTKAESETRAAQARVRGIREASVPRLRPVRPGGPASNGSVPA